MTINFNSVTWIDGHATALFRSLTDQMPPDGVSCVYIDPERTTGDEWMVSSCLRNMSYICQKRATEAGLSPYIFLSVKMSSVNIRHI